jgi:hypothetical protein
MNLPTMRGLNVMMVIVVRGPVIHNERQYTDATGIWQARKYFRFHMIPNFVRSVLVMFSPSCVNFITYLKDAKHHAEAGYPSHGNGAGMKA